MRRDDQYRPVEPPNSSSSSPNLAARPEQRVWEPTRIRISRACDRCKKRKIRCTGTQPCDMCVRVSASCAYASPYHRGRRPPLLVHNGNGVSLQESPHSPDLVAHRPSEPPVDSSSLANDMTTGELPSRTSPEPITDLQGHYIGPASGVSFLARVQKRLHQGNHASSNFTFGDVPLPNFDPIPSVMVSREETSRLVQRFFDFTMPIDRFFEQSTIEKWLQEFCETMGSMNNTEDAPAKRATLWMVFAMAQEHMTEEPGGEDKAADYQLSKIRGTVSLTIVQARLCQCFWLLSRSRVNHCWDLFGSTARSALVLGLHRKHHPALVSSRSPIELDCCRRTFWKLPCGADDRNLAPEHRIVSQKVDIYPIMLAPVAYYKLHRIVSLILRDLYSIRPASISTQCSLATKYSQMLKDWRDTVPRFLIGDNEAPIPLIPIFRRQRDVLNLSYWHTLIIMHRPLLLRKVALLQRGGQDAINDAQVERSVSECLAAALHIVEEVEEMFQSERMFRSFWGTCYYGFSAAVVLYVYTILLGSTTTDMAQTYLDAAIRYQGQLSRITAGGSLLARYWLVLEELRLEALKRTQGESDPPPIDQEMAILYAPIAYPDIHGGFVGFQPGMASMGNLAAYPFLDWQP
ncbi:hypothetical protein F5884DRAFT_823181 [Xylogone sp. PMI_703]|nr:hypothetical protein F5884DRAFT_823181 [Xylogone sp. PMI_703]